jgi:hypothetical protein
MGVVLGLLGAIVGIGAALLKLALLVALPIWAIAWLYNRATRERRFAEL